jgi:hypothetical protein
MESCLSCHPNGMREINPVSGSYNAADGQAIAAMNERMRSYEGVDWGAAFTPAAYGPSIGMEQGCVRCHNGGTGFAPISRGALHPLTNPDHLRYKVHDDLSMAPTTSLARKKVQDYLRSLPDLIPEEVRLAMMAELHPASGASLFDSSLRTLEWLRNHNRPDGTPWLSEGEYGRYAQILQDWRADNVGQLPTAPSKEMVQEWMLTECDLPEEVKGADQADRSLMINKTNPTPTLRSSDAISQ